ncbi:HIRAN domain-containing protein [Sphingosinicella sp. BN140058]|uniref:HIRAN domain-containing protein n=1 Tax=Sphingosinicella sp. BN140058 TaxID=1892855 RepID=UPI0013EACDBD|nr:HIRAN domain-containing protein [Sphingosinicella sp. BN140058]
MAQRDLSLIIVGVAYPNRDGGNRQFEVAMCTPGEPVTLVPEPTNKADPAAVAVYSCRGVQIGYLSAERCVWIGGKLRQGQEMKAIFQEGSSRRAVIRLNLDGHDPALPLVRSGAAMPAADVSTMASDPDSGF